MIYIKDQDGQLMGPFPDIKDARRKRIVLHALNAGPMAIVRVSYTVLEQDHELS